MQPMGDARLTWPPAESILRALKMSRGSQSQKKSAALRRMVGGDARFLAWVPSEMRFDQGLDEPSVVRMAGNLAISKAVDQIFRLQAGAGGGKGALIESIRPAISSSAEVRIRAEAARLLIAAWVTPIADQWPNLCEAAQGSWSGWSTMIDQRSLGPISLEGGRLRMLRCAPRLFERTNLKLNERNK